jgi:hypothetical protein
MNTQLLNKQERVLFALSNAGLLQVQSGFAVEQRTIYGLCGDSSDLAFSIEWRDSVGCKWAADFTEESLASASVTDNQITLTDSEGEAVCVEFYDLKAGNF